MSLALLVIVALAAVNPPCVRAALPRHEAALVGVLGATAAWLVLVPMAALSGVLLDGTHVAASTLRMALGVVLGLQGGAGLLTGRPSPEPALAGRWAALVPVAFPVTLTPGLGLLAVSAAADRSAPVALVVVAGALAVAPTLAILGPAADSPVGSRALDGLARAMAGLLVLGGLALLMDGVFDI